ncbi:MAG: DUF6236 family protein [Acidobacteriota bacterium]
MNRTILYYPDIHVPTSGPWIRSALLYWDKLAAIVPRSYDDMQDEKAMQRYSDEIQSLYSDGIFRPINPDVLMGNAPERERFEAEVVSQLPKLSKRRSTKKTELSTPVFKQKLSQHLFENLKLAGVAEERKKTRQDSYCYYFDATAAEIYMALLADYLARNDSEVTIPATDQNRAFDLTFKQSSGTVKDLTVAAKLFDILPCPTEDVSLGKILKFRKKYRSELLAFRAAMSGFEKGLIDAPDQRAMKAFVIQSKEQIEGTCLDLESALKGSGVTTFLGAIQAFLKAPSVYLVSGATVLLGQATEITKVPVRYGVASAVVTGLVEVSVQHLTQRRERKGKLRNEPFAYLFLAKKRLGRK